MLKVSDIRAGVSPVIDGASFGIAGGALLGLLPPIAAAMSILWITIQIYDYFDKRYKREQYDNSQKP